MMRQSLHEIHRPRLVYVFAKEPERWHSPARKLAFELPQISMIAEERTYTKSSTYDGYIIEVSLHLIQSLDLDVVCRKFEF